MADRHRAGPLRCSWHWSGGYDDDELSRDPPDASYCRCHVNRYLRAPYADGDVMMRIRAQRKTTSAVLKARSIVSHDQVLSRLVDDMLSGKMSRRSLMRRATALGIAAPTIARLLDAKTLANRAGGHIANGDGLIDEFETARPADEFR